MIHRLLFLSCLFIAYITTCHSFLTIKRNQALYVSTRNKQGVFVLKQTENHENKNIAIDIRGGAELSKPSLSLPKRASLLFSFTTLIFALSFKFTPIQIMSKFNTLIEKDSINRFIVQLIGTNLFSLAVTSYHGVKEKKTITQSIAKGLQKRCIFFGILMLTDRARGLGINYKPLIALEVFYVVCTYILSSSFDEGLKSVCSMIIAGFSVFSGLTFFFYPSHFLQRFGLILESKYILYALYLID